MLQEPLYFLLYCGIVGLWIVVVVLLYSEGRLGFCFDPKDIHYYASVRTGTHNHPQSR
jgi:hypothetical protein